MMKDRALFPMAIITLATAMILGQPALAGEGRRASSRPGAPTEITSRDAYTGAGTANTPRDSWGNPSPSAAPVEPAAQPRARTLSNYFPGMTTYVPRVNTGQAHCVPTRGAVYRGR